MQKAGLLSLDYSVKPTVKLNPATIECAGPVGRVRWRPQRRDYLGSSSLVVDFNINVWDVKRPYVPFATFDEHKVRVFMFLRGPAEIVMVLEQRILRVTVGRKRMTYCL